MIFIVRKYPILINLIIVHGNVEALPSLIPIDKMRPDRRFSVLLDLLL